MHRETLCLGASLPPGQMVVNKLYGHYGFGGHSWEDGLDKATLLSSRRETRPLLFSLISVLTGVPPRSVIVRRFLDELSSLCQQVGGNRRFETSTMRANRQLLMDTPLRSLVCIGFS